MNSSFNYNKYISNCDFLNKYNLKDLREKPFLNKVNLQFSIENLGKTASISNLESQVKAFYIFYILFGIKSYISINKNSISTNLSDCSPENFDFKIVLSNRKDIELFLFTLFFENSQYFLNKKSFFKEINHFGNKKNFNCNTSISIKLFNEMNDLFKNGEFDFDLNDSNFNLNLLFSNFSKRNNSKQLIKNISPFWING